MNRTICIGALAYEKHTFLIETVYLAELEQQAREEGETLTELLNKIPKGSLNDEQQKQIGNNSELIEINHKEVK